MKVNIITIDEVKIKRWEWWSNWIDIAVFNFGGGGYLLQMKVNRVNSKKFKAVAFKGTLNVAHAMVQDAGDLVQSKEE